MPSPTSAMLLIAVTLSAGSLSAQGRVFWQEGGVVICDSTWSVGQAVAPDGTGGILAVWADTRGNHESVWAQHVDRDGNRVWQEDGVFLRGNTWSPQQFSAVPDGVGGLIAVWKDAFAGPYVIQVTAQRVDSLGRVRWGASGVVVAGSNQPQDYAVSAVSDGRGGVLVGWVVTPSESVPNDLDTLRVQRLDSLGRSCWGSTGVLVAADTLDVYQPTMCPDGSGGACFAWVTREPSQCRPFAQRVDSAGHVMWAEQGIQYLSSGYSPTDIVPVGGRFVILGGMGGRIRAQLLNSGGDTMWGADGRLVSAGAGFIWGWVRGCDAGASGTYAVWCERRAGVFDVYVQLLDTAGNRRWDSLGVVVGSVNSSQEQAVAAIGDGRTGVIVAWPMYSDSTASWDVYAQRVDSAGQLLWGASGFGVAVDSGRQSSPSVATDARGGAIVVWGRSYAGDSVGLSAQRIGDAVSVTEPWMEFPRHSSLSVNPNPTRRVFSVGYDVTRSDHVLVGIHYCPVISRIVSVG